MDGERATTPSSSAAWRRARALEASAMQDTWTCYHVIGDSLRGAHSSPRTCRHAILGALPRGAGCRADGARAAARAHPHVAARDVRVGGGGHDRRRHGRRLDRVLDGRRAAQRDRQGARGRDDPRGAGQAASGRRERIPARAPGILAGHGHPGRRAVPARRDCRRPSSRSAGRKPQRDDDARMLGSPGHHPGDGCDSGVGGGGAREPARATRRASPRNG